MREAEAEAHLTRRVGEGASRGRVFLPHGGSSLLRRGEGAPHWEVGLSYGYAMFCLERALLLVSAEEVAAQGVSPGLCSRAGLASWGEGAEVASGGQEGTERDAAGRWKMTEACLCSMSLVALMLDDPVRSLAFARQLLAKEASCLPRTRCHAPLSLPKTPHSRCAPRSPALSGTFFESSACRYLARMYAAEALSLLRRPNEAEAALAPLLQRPKEEAWARGAGRNGELARYCWSPGGGRAEEGAGLGKDMSSLFVNRGCLTPCCPVRAALARVSSFACSPGAYFTGGARR